VVGVKKSLM